MCACYVASVMLDSATPRSVAHQAPLTIGFSRQEYWSGLPCPPPGYLSDSGIEPMSLSLLHWQVGDLPLAPHGKSSDIYARCIKCEIKLLGLLA